MQRGRWDRGKRWLTALLTILAAFAFPVRGPLMALLPEGLAMGEMHMQHATAAAAASPDSSDQHPQNHQAHCLFCLTGAFALQADSAALPPAPVVHVAPSPPVAVYFRVALLRHADARAPPHHA
ncbi:DUF2946 domain-containing protein [Deinococcus sp. Arct2-2]|uniref:DUF2946 family protein n=1 Tax=Deinococcus sp. Arct2-2 TaxID=2568653 RepID=UPI0010A45357|nr:DUF2946 family protein [Deinococcus sp. Arct2-2]THF70025.1 DUF2946 domain-containing protein [Deinococcus sp. Arct2-2]